MDYDQRVFEIALQNLKTMSRTANGIIDSSSSASKEDVFLVRDAEKAAKIAEKNYLYCIQFGLDHRNNDPDSVETVRKRMEYMFTIVNEGIVKPGTLYRNYENKHKERHTSLEDMEKNVDWFYRQIFKRIKSRPFDAVETAAFVEYHMNIRFHMWADGCQKCSMLAAAFIMMHGGKLPVLYRDRDEYYSYAPSGILDCNDNCTGTCEYYEKFLEYYKTLQVEY